MRRNQFYLFTRIFCFRIDAQRQRTTTESEEEAGRHRGATFRTRTASPILRLRLEQNRLVLQSLFDSRVVGAIFSAGSGGGEEGGAGEGRGGEEGENMGV